MSTPAGEDPQLLADATVAAAAQEMADAEDSLTAAALRAIAAYLGLARDALLGGTGLPDLAAFPADSEWLRLVAEYLEAAERDIYLAAYRRMLPEDTLADPAPWVERFIATVSDRLRIWPAGAFEEIRLELADGIARGETIDQLRDRIGASLDIDAPSREIRDRIAGITAEIGAAEDPAAARQLRAQRAGLYRDLGESDRQWHWKARRIARTETTMAVNGGLHDATEARIAATGETGFRKQWLATTDDRVRASHARANGQVAFWGQPFLVGGHHMQHPGSPGAPAAEVCNCRCTLLILPPGADPFPLEPIGEDAPGNLAAATTPEAAVAAPDALLAHNRPGDHPMGRGRYLRGSDAHRSLTTIQAKRWEEAPPAEGFKASLGDYIGLGYLTVNQGLRSPSPKLTDTVLNLDEAFAGPGAVLPENVVVWRGTSRAEEVFGGMAEGDEFVDHGFVSTTFDPDYAGKFNKLAYPKDKAVISILVSAGSRALALDSFFPGSHSEEQELLLPRGSKFHVVKITHDEGADPAYRVELELVDTPDQKSTWDAVAAAAPPPPPGPPAAAGPDERFGWLPGDLELTEDIPRPDEQPAAPGEETPVTSSARPAAASRRTSTVTASAGALPDGWRGPLVPLGIPSCDDRVIGVPDGDPPTRPLPRPLKGQYAAAEGHDGATVIGLIDRVWIDVDPAGSGVPMLFGEGPLDLADPASAEWARRLGEGYAGWVSVDLDLPTVTEMVWDENTGQLLEAPAFTGAEGDGEGGLADLISGLFDSAPALPDGQRVVAHVSPWRLMSATLVADQAFAEVQVKPVYGYTRAATEPAAVAAAAAPGDLMTAPIRTRPNPATSTNPGGAAVLVAAPPPPPARNAPPPAKDQAAPPLPAVGDRVIVENPDAGGPGEVTAVDTAQNPPMITVNLDAGGPVTVPADQVTPEPATGQGPAGQAPPKKAPPFGHAAAHGTATITASGGPLRPPAAWFADPALPGPTPLTITADGRVTGHLAVWGTCHTGYENMCVTPPRSATSYTLFHNGEVECADGTLLACGKITLGGGHADPAAGLRAAVEHYDDTCTAAAIVRAHEDQYGIAVAGALCPGVPASTVAALRRSPLSGDWRRYGGNLELVAALAVNTPGFPVRRPSLAAAANAQGRQNSLVAAGVLAPAPAALAASIADAVAENLDSRDRRRARIAALQARMTAPAPPAYARTRAARAAARIAATARRAR